MRRITPFLVQHARTAGSVVPTILFELLKGRDPQKRNRVMPAMFKMVGLDIETLRRA